MRLTRSVMAWLNAFGIDVLKFFLAVRGLPQVLREYSKLKRQNAHSAQKWPIRFNLPCLHDRYAESGTASGHYFHQDLYVARRIFERRPIKHVDVGSRIDGFVAHVAAFREIEVFDIRPLNKHIPNIVFRQCDLMRLSPELVGCCDSLSCLHVIEHFGLGRYGDPINIQGHLEGLNNLSKMLEPGGMFYFSTPVGSQRIEFNGQRVFAIDTILQWARDQFELVSFSYVDDAGDLHENAFLDEQSIARNLGLTFGCGIFELQKR